MEYPRFDLTGQVSLVTGAARGLGRAIALALAHAGSDVALGLRDANTARDLADEVQSMGRKSLSLQMDVTHLDQICRAVDKAASYFRSEEHTSELQSQSNLVCRLLLEKKNRAASTRRGHPRCD